MSDHHILRVVWPLLAAVAGAITALSFRPFTAMTRVEIVMALFVGTFFAVFVGPWVAQRLFGTGPVDLRVLGGVFYLLASGSNVLIPPAVRWLGRIAGMKEDKS